MRRCLITSGVLTSGSCVPKLERVCFHPVEEHDLYSAKVLPEGKLSVATNRTSRREAE